MYFWVVAGVRAYDDVGIGRLAVDFCRNCPVVFPLDKDVEECDFSFLFFFTGKLDSWVDAIEAVVEIRCGITAVVVVS